jgi:hypothetical protein
MINIQAPRVVTVQLNMYMAPLVKITALNRFRLQIGKILMVLLKKLVLDEFSLHLDRNICKQKHLMNRRALLHAVILLLMKVKKSLFLREINLHTRSILQRRTNKLKTPLHTMSLLQPNRSHQGSIKKWAKLMPNQRFNAFKRKSMTTL